MSTNSNSTQSAPASQPNSSNPPAGGAPTGGQQSTTGTPPATGAARSFGAGEGSGENTPANPAGESPWYSNLPDDLKGDPTIQKYKTVEELARGTVNQAKLLGKKPTFELPDKFDDTQKAQIFDRLGRPKEATEYKFNFPENAPVVKEMIPQYQTAMHKMGLSQEQASAMCDVHAEIMMKHHATLAKAEEDRKENGFLKLEGKLGQNYNAFTQASDHAFNHFDKIMGGELLAHLKNINMADDPVLHEVFGLIGQGMAEHGINTGRGGDGSFTMSPSQSLAEIERLKGDAEFSKALRTESDPGHKAAKERWDRLHKNAYPSR